MQPSVFSRIRWYVFVLFVVAAVFAVIGRQRAMDTNSNRVEDWLPPKFQETQDLKWFIKHFTGDDILMISWEGCTIDDPRAQLMAEALREPVTIDGDGEIVRAESEPAADASEKKSADESLLLFREVILAKDILDRLREKAPDIDEEVLRAEMEGWIVGPPNRETGQRTSGVVVLITEEGWIHRHSLLKHINETADKIDGLSSNDLHMAGPTLDSVEIDKQSAFSLETMSLISAVVCVTIMLFCFRSITLVLCSFLIAVFNQYLAVALVYYAGSTMDSILLMVPSLVYVLSISAAVHLVNYYRDATQEHGLLGAPTRMLHYGWVPCSLAATTTGLGLVSLLISFLVPIQKFGGFAALGLMFGTGVLFLMMPCLLEQFPVRKWDTKTPRKPQQLMSNRWRLPTILVSRYYRVIGVGGLVVLALGAWGMTQIQSTARIHDMFSQDARILKDYDWLEENVGPLIPIEVVLRVPRQRESNEGDAPPTGDEALYPNLAAFRLIDQVEQSMREVDGVSSIISPAKFNPSKFDDSSPSIYSKRTLSKSALESNLRDGREAFIKAGLLRETEDEDLWRISARAKASDRPDYGKMLSDLREHVDPHVAAGAEYAIPDVKVVYSGAVPLVQKAQLQLLEDLFNSFMLAFVFIGVAMIVLLRSFAAGLLSMIPNVLPCVLVFGIMGWIGVKVEVGSMMTATAAMGIAVDDTLHYVTWFRRGIAQGKTRRAAIGFAYQRCGGAMIQTTLICGLGLLVFAFSPFGPISRFGVLMCSMLAAALIGDLLVLPALLVSPLGKVFAKRTKKRAEPKPV